MTTAFSRLLLPSEDCLCFHSVEDLPTDFPSHVTVIAEITDRQAEDRLYALSLQLGCRLFVPEVWQRLLPEAGILISSQLSGGTLMHRLSEVQSSLPGRCWLRLKPYAQCLRLPCPSGCGEAISRDSLLQHLGTKPSFYSPELGCSYLYDFPKGVILFQKEDHIEELSSAAKQAGFCGTVEGPW